MDYPAECIAIGAKGKKEARVLMSKGTDFIVYGYVDVDSSKTLGKYSILMRQEAGIEHLFIIRGVGGKELVVKHEMEKSPERRGIYDLKTKQVFYF